MLKTFKLELKIVLTDKQQQKLIEAARRVYAAGSASVGYDGESSRELSPEEFIDGPEGALTYVLGQNALLDELDIHADELSCMDLDHEDSDQHPGVFGDDQEEVTVVATSSTDEEDLDEWEEGLYLCRWPNGEFSVVKGASKRDALVQLDEWAGAQASWLVPLETFMADFRLNDLGAIEFKEFGEETNDFIREHCYPELEAVLSSHAVTSLSGDYSAAEKKVIKKAVARERTRLRENQSEGPAARTELGKRLQKTMGTTGPVADHYVELGAKRILESETGQDGKPN